MYNEWIVQLGEYKVRTGQPYLDTPDIIWILAQQVLHQVCD